MGYLPGFHPNGAILLTTLCTCIALCMSVVVPPSHPEILLHARSVKEDKPVEFECRVERAVKDSVSLRWQLESRQYIDVNAITRRQSLDDDMERVRRRLEASFGRDDHGKFLCCNATIVDSDRNTSNDSVMHQLNISYTYHTMVDTIEYAAQGTPVRVECVPSSDANPGEKLRYVWTLNGKTYPHHTPDNVTDVLLIEAIEIYQAGKYQCQIENGAGWTPLGHAKSKTLIVKALPTEPAYVNVKEVTSTAVILEWPHTSENDAREYFYRVFHKQDGDQMFRLMPGEPEVVRDHGVKVGLTVTELRPLTMNYFKVQSYTDDPDVGMLYSHGAVIEANTTAAPVIEIFGMDIYGGTIFIRWSYSNPTDDVKIRLKMTIMENENMICQYVVDAENLYTVQNGTFDPSVDYYVQVEILEGTFQRTMLPVLQFPTEQSSIMRNNGLAPTRRQAIIGNNDGPLIPAAIAAGSLFAIIVIAICVCWCKKKKDASRRERTTSFSIQMRHQTSAKSEPSVENAVNEEIYDSIDESVIGKRCDVTKEDPAYEKAQTSHYVSPPDSPRRYTALRGERNSTEYDDVNVVTSQEDEYEYISMTGGTEVTSFRPN